MPTIEEPREVWRIFARNYYLFRGTPTRLWLDYAFRKALRPQRAARCQTNADHYYDVIAEQARDHGISAPRAVRPLRHRGARHHRFAARFARGPPAHPRRRAFRRMGGPHPAHLSPGFCHRSGVSRTSPRNIEALGEITGEDTDTWRGYMRALAARRHFFKAMGATATDHGHPTAQTADLDRVKSRRACMRPSSKAQPTTRSRSSSARKCSPRWRA